MTDHRSPRVKRMHRSFLVICGAVGWCIGWFWPI